MKKAKKPIRPIKRTLSHRMAQLDSRLESLIQLHNDNRKQHLEHVDTVAARLLNSDRGISGVESTVEAVNRNVNRLTERVAALEKRIPALESSMEVINQVLAGHGDHYNRLHTRLLRLEQVPPKEFSATSDEPAVDVLWRLVDGLTEYTTKRYGRRRL